MNRRSFIGAALGAIAGAVAIKTLPPAEPERVLIAHPARQYNYRQLGYNLTPDGWAPRLTDAFPDGIEVGRIGNALYYVGGKPG